MLLYIRIRDLREDRDWTQKAIAAQLNIGQATYSRYEAGKLDIPTAALVKLAALYKTSIDYLLGITDDPRPYPRSRG